MRDLIHDCLPQCILSPLALRRCWHRGQGKEEGLGSFPNSTSSMPYKHIAHGFRSVALQLPPAKVSTLKGTTDFKSICGGRIIQNIDIRALVKQEKVHIIHEPSKAALTLP
ncbi:hypothetical protein Tcan_00758, partial [Toxocara canis]